MTKRIDKKRGRHMFDWFVRDVRRWHDAGPARAALWNHGAPDAGWDDVFVDGVKAERMRIVWSRGMSPEARARFDATESREAPQRTRRAELRAKYREVVDHGFGVEQRAAARTSNSVSRSDIGDRSERSES